MRKNLALCSILLVGIFLASGAMAAPTLTSVNVQPNPALISDTLTISAVGSEAIIASAGGNPSYNSTTWLEYYKYFCQSFVASETGYLNSVGFKILAGYPALSLYNLTVFDYAASDELGAVLSRSPDSISAIGGQPSCSTASWQYFEDFNESTLLTQGVNYFACGQSDGAVVGYHYMCSNSTSDGNYLYLPETSFRTINLLDDTLQMDVRIADNEPVRLVVKLPGGDYDSSYFARSEYFTENPWLTTIPPIQSGETTIQAKIYGQTTGYSGEIQIPFSMIAPDTIAGEGVGIYIQAIEETDTFYRFGTETKHNSKMHQYSAFSANTDGGFVGRIRVDGGMTTTCNYEWDCQTDLNVGTHQYALYSTIGDFLYVGNFTVDLNSTIVKIYIPITYNLFDIYEDESETSLVECNDIYSIDIFDDPANVNRISASLYINDNDIYLDDDTVIPRNCYTSVPYNINPLFPYALPGFSGEGLMAGIEPMHIQYTDGSGGVDCENGCLLGSHLLGGFGSTTITGSRSRQGFLNFYKLDAVASYYPGSGQSWSGYVSQRQDNPDDGLISPLTSLSEPAMNLNSALYGDAEYNPYDFGNGDDIYCETSLTSHGYVAYDVNVLLLVDKNRIYDQYSFTPYKKYNSVLTGLTNNGWGSNVWHKFSSVDHNGLVQCAFQVTNEIGYRSGWAYSKTKRMWPTNQSAAGGIGIIVRENDGAVSQSLHRSTITLDLNKIDVLNYEAGTEQTLDSADSPYTLAYGDNVIAYTGIVGVDVSIPLDGNADYAHWPLNEASGTNVNDVSGNNRDGTTINMEDGDWTGGKLNNALLFDGANEYVDCGNIANFDKDDAFSAEAWFRSNSATAQDIVSRMASSAPYKGWTLQLDSSGVIYFYLNNSTSGNNYLGVYVPVTDWADDAWHHVVVTYDGSTFASGVNIYVDDVNKVLSVAKDTLTATTLNSEICSVGSRGGGLNYWKGYLDEVVIYNKELVQSDVSTRYNGGSGTETPLGGEELVFVAGDLEIMSKIFAIFRGDVFDISLYLPDYNVTNAAPVGRNTTLRERSQFGRIECSTGFYDTWLDYETATFRFWTNQSGSYYSPLCTKETTQAFTTNCNPNERRNGTKGECFATNYNEMVSSVFLSECAEANDCWVTENFSKADCIGIVPSTVVGYCSIELEDNAGNISTRLASAPLSVQEYQVFALCETYALVAGEKENIVFTSQDTGYMECIVGLDNVLNPDSNFSIVIEGKTLDFLRSDFDDYLDQTTHVFRSDITNELEEYATTHSTDGETWEGQIPVFVTHQSYGSLDTFVHASVTFVGNRFISDSDEDRLEWGGEGFFGMSENDFKDWFTGTMNGFFLLLSNPLGWITGNFFMFLVIIFLVIILAPLALYFLAASAKIQRERG